MRTAVFLILTSAALVYMATETGWLQPVSSTSAPSQYVTAPIEKGDIQRTVTATGTLNAIVNVEVGSQLSGQIARMFVDFNDDVKKGQPLAELDQRTFQARLNEAQAALETAEVSVKIAKARLERARVDASDSEAQRAVLRARTDNARVRLAAANSELQRKLTLRERGATAATDVEDATAKRDSAAAALREAEAIAAAHENTVAGTKADLRRAEAELESALASVPQRRALLNVAQLDLERTIIRSPVNGVVVGRNVSEGQTLATTLEAKTIFILAGDLREMEIHAKVDETDIGKIAVGQDATFTVDAFPGRSFVAKVRQVRKAPQVQQNVVTYTVVLATANPDNILLPGMTAVVRITVSTTGSVLKIPLSALRFSPKPGEASAPAQTDVAAGKPATVWVADSAGKPQAVTIGIGDDDTTMVAMLSGSFKEGDPVMVGEVSNAASKRLFGIRLGL